jgi:hypothetical protein
MHKGIEQSISENTVIKAFITLRNSSPFLEKFAKNPVADFSGR